MESQMHDECLILSLPGLISSAFEDGSDGEKGGSSHATRERAKLLCGYGNCSQSMGDDTALIQISLVPARHNAVQDIR